MLVTLPVVEIKPSVRKFPPWMLPVTLIKLDTDNMVAVMLGPVILPVADMIALVILPAAMLAAAILPVELSKPVVSKLPA